MSEEGRGEKKRRQNITRRNKEGWEGRRKAVRGREGW